MLSEDEKLYARTDLKVFSELCFTEEFPDTWFHKRWYDVLQDRSIKYGLIIAPRNSAKSTCWAKKGPLWLLGNNPDLRIVLISRTAERAQSNLAFIRLNAESNDRVREVFPFKEVAGRVYGLSPSSPWGTERITFKNNRMDGAPSVYAVGLEGSITGIRADVIIIDDLVDSNNVMTDTQRDKVNAFWDSVVMPTMNPGGRILAVGTRFHSKDFYSRLLEDSKYKKSTFMFPAILLDDNGEYLLGEDGKPQSYWPERWEIDELLKMKEDMGSLAFASQYQCDPSGYAGTLFDVEDIHFYDPVKDILPIWNDLDFVVSGDPNITSAPNSDNTAIVTAAVDRKRSHIYVLDIYAKPLEFVEQVKMLHRYGARTQVQVGSHRFESEIKISKIGVDSTAYQRSLQQTGYLMGLPIVEIKTGNQNKDIRILGLQAHFESGRILLPDPDKCKTGWWEPFYEEYCTFPKGRRDDRLDALEILVSMVSSSFGVSGIPWGPTDDTPLRRLFDNSKGRPVAVFGGVR